MPIAISAVANSLRHGSNSFLMSSILRPLAAKKSFFLQITASGALAGTSDILCQKLVEKRDTINFKRAAGFAAIVSFCVVSALAGTSDILCQKLVEKRDTINFKRAAGFAAIVSFCVAPLCYKWYQVIERTFPAVGPKWKLALKRMTMDQVIGAPFFSSLILFNLNMIETRSVKTSVAKTADIVPTVLLTNYKFWPFIQMVNLALVPIQYRVVMVQFCSIFWNMYISYMQHNSAKETIDIVEISD
uniref:Uncharacterized protein n=1 Tax=Panagrolaimus sp. ES5 TaxID=591445 RepID=A0AC34EZX4_9BILA